MKVIVKKGPGEQRKGQKIIRQKRVKISDYLRQQEANEKRRKESNTRLREQREEIIDKMGKGKINLQNIDRKKFDENYDKIKWKGGK